MLCIDERLDVFKTLAGIMSLLSKQLRMQKKIKHLIRNTYYAANPRVVFTSKPLLTPGGKDPVSIFNKSIIIYQYSCCYTASYIGLKTKQLRKRIKEHIPKCIKSFCCLDNKDIIPAKVLNASKRSSMHNI